MKVVINDKTKPARVSQNADLLPLVPLDLMPRTKDNSISLQLATDPARACWPEAVRSHNLNMTGVSIALCHVA